MLTRDGLARRRAWIAMYLLGATLALWTSVGIEHAFGLARREYGHCRARRAAAGCRQVLAQDAPLRPAWVWILAGAGIVLLGCAALATVLVLRTNRRQAAPVTEPGRWIGVLLNSQ